MSATELSDATASMAMEHVANFTTNSTRFFLPLDLPPTDTRDLDEDPCYIYKSNFLDVEWWLVAVFGTALCCISIIENLLLMVVFLKRRQFGQSHFYYMYWLCLFDIFIAVSYIMLMSIDTIKTYYDWSFGYTMWYWYVHKMYAVCHVVMVTSAWLIVSATLEKYCRLVSALNQVYELMIRHRIIVVFSALMIGLITKGSLYFEIEVVDTGCPGNSQYDLQQTALTMDNYFYVQSMFLLRSVLCVLVPFFLLAFCNVHIVIVLLLRQMQATTHRSSTIGGRPDDNQAASMQMSVASATRMLVLVITSYLIANCLNIVITFWEFINKTNLLYDYNEFYTVSSILVSLLTVLAGALRLPIYCTGNDVIRSEILSILMLIFCPLMRWKKHTRHRDSQRQTATANFQTKEEWLQQWSQNQTESVALVECKDQIKLSPRDTPSKDSNSTGHQNMVSQSTNGSSTTRTQLVNEGGNCNGNDWYKNGDVL